MLARHHELKKEIVLQFHLNCMIVPIRRNFRQFSQLHFKIRSSGGKTLKVFKCTPCCCLPEGKKKSYFSLNFFFLYILDQKNLKIRLKNLLQGNNYNELKYTRMKINTTGTFLCNYATLIQTKHKRCLIGSFTVMNLFAYQGNKWTSA